MELLEAIKHVLIINKKPMHFKDIAKTISSEKLIEKKGTQTLETVIVTRLALEVKKAEKLKIHTDFLKLNNGLIGLKNYNEPKVEEAPVTTLEADAAPPETQTEDSAAPPSVCLQSYLDANYIKIKARFIEKLNKLPFLVFERLVENLLRELGFAKYTVVNRRTDGGIDYAINFQQFASNVNMLVVIRRWPAQRKYGVKNAEELIKIMTTHKFNIGAVILFSEYETDVNEYIKANSPYPIMLLTIEELASMLISRGVGVTKNIVETYSINDDYISVLESEIIQKIEKHKKNTVPNVSKNIKNPKQNGRSGFYGSKKPNHLHNQNKNNP